MPEREHFAQLRQDEERRERAAGDAERRLEVDDVGEARAVRMRGDDEHARRHPEPRDQLSQRGGAALLRLTRGDGE